MVQAQVITGFKKRVPREWEESVALVRNVLYNKRKEIVSGRTLALPHNCKM